MRFFARNAEQESQVPCLNLEPFGAEDGLEKMAPTGGTSGLHATKAGDSSPTKLDEAYKAVLSASSAPCPCGHPQLSIDDIVRIVARPMPEISGTNESGTQTQTTESSGTQQEWDPEARGSGDPTGVQPNRSGTQLPESQSCGTQLPEPQSCGSQARGSGDPSGVEPNRSGTQLPEPQSCGTQSASETGIHRNVQYLLQGGSSAQCLAPGQIGAHGNRMEAQNFRPKVKERTPKIFIFSTKYISDWDSLWWTILMDSIGSVCGTHIPIWTPPLQL